MGRNSQNGHREYEYEHVVDEKLLNSMLEVSLHVHCIKELIVRKELFKKDNMIRQENVKLRLEDLI